MTYSIQTASWQLRPAVPASVHTSCDCHQAQKFCTPSFVFSIAGQVGFRYALLHLLSCPQRDCGALRSKAIEGMKQKINWLFQENALLGCVYVQPYIYGAKRMIFSKNNFKPVAHHLAHCPRESCAKLRRSVLLTIRSHVSPAAHRQIEAVEESDPE